MKELTIEQKAEAYDMALESIQEILNSGEDSIKMSRLQLRLQGIFPELKESEDERIRKEIIQFIKKRDRSGCDYDYDQWIAWLEEQSKENITDALQEQRKEWTVEDLLNRNQIADILQEYNRNDLIAWLEKQGNKPQGKSALEAINEEKVDNQNCVKTIDEVESKFKVGDWIISDTADKDYHICKITSIKDGNYTIESTYGYKGYNQFDVFDNVYRLWTIEDAKDGDVLVLEDEISLYKHDIKNCTKKETTFGGFVYHCCYDGKRFITDSLYSLTEQDKTDIYPATKEQRDLLFFEIHKAGYEWDAEKKELKEIESNPDDLIEECNQQQADDLIDMVTEKSACGEEEERPLLEKFKQAVYVCAWGKVTCKAEGETKEEYANRWAEHFFLIVRDWADDYIDYTIQQKLRKSYDKGKESAIKENSSAWSEEDENRINRLIAYFEDKESFTAEDDIVYANWLKSLKDRVQPQPQQEWSKDDVRNIQDIDSVLFYDKNLPEDTCIRLRNWLKSLRPQRLWKPSDEQMITLRQAISGCSYDIEPLVEIEEHLKKLREE